MATGDVLTAVRPLTISDLGHDAPIRLIEAGDELVLEMYNYLGPEKVFWDMERNSRFFRGEPQCGFYAELAERSACPDGAAFAAAVASGTLKDEVEAPFTTYLDLMTGQRRWTVEYVRDGSTIGLAVDLMNWELLRRWTQNGDLGWPMLESPVARQNADGRVEVSGAVLTCGPHPAWLYAHPEARLWVAGYEGEPAPLELRVPDGTVHISRMGTGLVVWEQGVVSVDALDVEGPVHVEGGALVR